MSLSETLPNGGNLIWWIVQKYSRLKDTDIAYVVPSSLVIFLLTSRQQPGQHRPYGSKNL